MKEKCIFHIDVNSAYLSWEAVYQQKYLGKKTDLRRQISAVGGDEKLRRGIVLAKSIPAGEHGVKTGQSLMEARQKCPGILIVPPRYDLYERCSDALMALLRQYSPAVEQYSIDEAFVDMTEVLDLWPLADDQKYLGVQLWPAKALKAAAHMKERIYRELGFTVNIGISTNKVLAKMASDFQKPDKIHTLYPSEIQTKMWPLPVGNLFFVGRATLKKLERLGIRTIGELARTDIELLRCHFKTHGTVIWGFANGLDTSAVICSPLPCKGYGNSTTIATDVDNEDAARLVLLELSEVVARRLRKDHVQIRVISVGIRTNNFVDYSHQTVLENPTNITGEIYKYACALFHQCWRGEAVRHLGIHTGQVSEYNRIRQMNMFDSMDYDKLAKMDAAVDDIRRRYGDAAIFRAALRNSPA